MKAHVQTSSGIAHLTCPHCKEDVLLTVTTQAQITVIDTEEFNPEQLKAADNDKRSDI